jgi:hypothetical protein
MGDADEADKRPRNRNSAEVTELKFMILVLAFNEVSSGSTTDASGLKQLMDVNILRWLEIFTDDYGQVFDAYTKGMTVAERKKVIDKLMFEVKAAFEFPSDWIRIAKEVIKVLTREFLDS